MTEKVQEEIGAIVVYQAGKPTPLPWKIKWKSRYFTFKVVDLCHPVWEGKTLHYIYSLSDGTNYFRLNLDTRSQRWILEEISDGLPN